jgi:5-methylcytosine-specific restriction endonuclease McrA
MTDELQAVQAAAPTASRTRKAIPRELQIRVFRRDRWLCRWCGRPVVFPTAMKYLLRWARQQGHSGELGWWSFAWRRDASPLLDHLGAVIDHVEAFSAGGAHDEQNFVTACNKCNVRKNSEPAAEFLKKNPLRPIKGKYGEPEHWDGLSTLFALMLHQDRTGVTRAELDWYKALTATRAS